MVYPSNIASTNKIRGHVQMFHFPVQILTYTSDIDPSRQCAILWRH